MIYISKISMEPSKWLMVEVLPKDLDYNDAIMEFIDNSITAANKLTNDGDLHGYELYITIKKDSFKIRDNCGGISEEEVLNGAFKLGHNDTSKAIEGQTSRYGIGMKRAFFKIGKNINVSSSTINFHFEIKLDVDEWVLQDGWGINLHKSIKRKNKSLGTSIEISSLTSDAIKAFTKRGFAVSLEEEVRQRYKDSLDRGIKIVINNSILGILPKEDMELIFTEEIKNEHFSGVLSIKKAQYNKDRAGWYISFNNRYIKIADKSNISGWGCTLIRGGVIGTKFEDKFSRFRGFIELNDKGTGSLPYNTSKSDLDTSSEVYALIREILISATSRSLGNFEDDLKSICYKKPVKEVEFLKGYLKVNTNKEIGETTFEEFLKNHNIKF